MLTPASGNGPFSTWALSAVAVDGGRRAKETLGEVPLAALTHSAATAAKFLAGVGVVVTGTRGLLLQGAKASA